MLLEERENTEQEDSGNESKSNLYSDLRLLSIDILRASKYDVF